jgi:hypothetical protein
VVGRWGNANARGVRLGRGGLRRFDLVHSEAIRGRLDDRRGGRAGVARWPHRTAGRDAYRAGSRDRQQPGRQLPLRAPNASLYVLEGEYSFGIADEMVAASVGWWVYVPRGTPHVWRCDSPGGRLLNVAVPGGFEGVYRRAGESVPDRTRLPARSEPDVEALSNTAARYGIRIVGPPPGA